MTKYWPNEPSMLLNIEVANLFTHAYSKLNFNLHNNTSRVLATDILNVQLKRRLFQSILLELEILILDIIELDLTDKDLKMLNKKISFDLIKKSMHRFSINFFNSENSVYNLLRFYCDYVILLEYLITYLVFGTQCNSDRKQIFNKSNTPWKYIEILLDNFIIQTANIIFRVILDSQTSISSLFDYLLSNQICNDTYISIRSIATFKNNLMWQSYINYYFIQPRICYSNRYQIWIFSPSGIIDQYIYASRDYDSINFSELQKIVIFLLELQDFVWPKIRQIFFFTVKLFIYIFSYFVQNFIKLLIKNIAFIMRAKEYK